MSLTNGYKIECVIPSCSVVRNAKSVDQMQKEGWRDIKISDTEPDPSKGHKKTGRTHLGFCPTCAHKFLVR